MPRPRRLARGSRDALPTVEVDVDAEVILLVESKHLTEAIELLSRKYGNVVYSMAFRITRHRADALDVLQQTFAEALRDLSTFKRRASIRVWLLGIAQHRALDVVRRSRRDESRRVEDPEAVELEEVTMPDVPSALDHRRRLQFLEQCLRQLEGETLAAVLMRFQQGLSYDEMAEALNERRGDNGRGRKAGSWQARVSRAFPVLRRCLKSKGVER